MSTLQFVRILVSVIEGMFGVCRNPRSSVVPELQRKVLIDLYLVVTTHRKRGFRQDSYVFERTSPLSWALMIHGLITLSVLIYIHEMATAGGSLEENTQIHNV